jgi:hypothetical protein
MDLWLGMEPILAALTRRLRNIMAGLGWEAAMKTQERKRTGEGTTAAAATLFAMALGLALLAGTAAAKKKEKVLLPDFVLKAETVVVLILPDTGEPMNDPFANRKAQQEVEKALMRWGRYRLAQEASTADLVIAVKKGSGKIANPTINGGPVDTRPGTIETTDNQIRIGVQQGTPPNGPDSGDATGSTGRASPGMEVGSTDDMFEVFRADTYSGRGAPVWTYMGKDGLKPPSVTAVEQFRKAVEEAEKAAARKQQQQQQQQQGQKKNP